MYNKEGVLRDREEMVNKFRTMVLYKCYSILTNHDNRTMVLCRYYIIYTNCDNNDISYAKNRS